MQNIPRSMKMKKKPSNETQSNVEAIPRLDGKLDDESFINNESTEGDVNSKIRRSTRRATIERRVWCPPQKEKFCQQKKYSHRGKPKGSKSAYVKWKELQKRKINCRPNFVKSKILAQRKKNLNGSKFSNLANGSYALDNLDREELIVENEVVSLQSVITDEVVTDSYSESPSCEHEATQLDPGTANPNPKDVLTIFSKSIESTPVNNISEPKNKLLDNNFEKLSLKSENIFQQTEDLELDAETSNNVANDDTHVSLDDALAELVDLEHGNDCETVTIHPVFNDNEMKSEVETVPHSCDEEPVPLNLIVNKSSDSENHSTEENECKILGVMSDEDSLVDMKQESDNQLDSENSCNSREESSSMEGMTKIPNLIRVSFKTPSIRTPLKCSECPMRFCTVRSLLWHFGTHLKFRTKLDVAPIILEDLFAAWDSPDKPITADDSNSYKTDYKWPWSGSAESVNGGEHYKVLDVDNFPEDLSMDRNLLGANGEVILKVPAIRKPTASRSLRDLLTAPNWKNDPQQGDSLKASKRTRKLRRYLMPRKYVSTNCKDYVYCSANGRQISNFIPTTLAYPPTPGTPTISTCYTPLDTCPTDANIRLLSHVSNTLDKLDTSGNMEHFSASNHYKSRSEGADRNIVTDEPVDDNSLVRINDNLALRIVSTAATVGELTISVTNSSEISDKSSQFTNTVSIFPQTGATTELSPTVPAPDILTIVPQTESSQRPAASPKTPPHILTAAGKLTPDSSRIMKLVLMSQDDNTTGRDCDAIDDSSEESDGGMVIDVKDEENAMDPLSLCAVTLDEEMPHVRATSAGNEDNRPLELINRNEKKAKTCRFNPPVDDTNYQKRKYVCQYCQKRFGWSTDLKRHIILHTGERPFKCKWCPITFTRKFLLQNHMRKMHPQLYTGPYKFGHDFALYLKC